MVPGTDTNDASQDASLSNGFSDLNWLSEVDDCNDEDIFKRFVICVCARMHVIVNVHVRVSTLYQFLKFD